MNKKLLFSAALVIAGLLLNNSEAFSQSSNMKAKKQCISGDKITNKGGIRPNKNTTRHLENNQKKKKIKTGTKSIRNKSCSNFNLFFSAKKNKRQKALARQRKKHS